MSKEQLSDIDTSAWLTPPPILPMEGFVGSDAIARQISALDGNVRRCMTRLQARKTITIAHKKTEGIGEGRRVVFYVSPADARHVIGQIEGSRIVHFKPLSPGTARLTKYAKDHGIELGATAPGQEPAMQAKSQVAVAARATIDPPATVTINKVSLSPIDYKGQRVVTFAQIDAVHGRTEGTARRNFNQNKKRLKEGVHFTKLSLDEIRTDMFSAHITSKTPSLTVLTERGYLMLVKSFTDDLAWEVQDKLVEAYFTPGRPSVNVERLVNESEQLAILVKEEFIDADEARLASQVMLKRRRKKPQNRLNIQVALDAVQGTIEGLEMKSTAMIEAQRVLDQKRGQKALAAPAMSKNGGSA